MQPDHEISFDVPKSATKLIARIIIRAKIMNPRVDGLSLSMDLHACHANGSPLDFKRLAAFDDFNFAHDVFGIMRHMDQSTGRLFNHFSPHAAMREKRSPSAEALDAAGA